MSDATIFLNAVAIRTKVYNQYAVTIIIIIQEYYGHTCNKYDL